MYEYYKGYIFKGRIFVTNKSDIHNASDDMFVEADAYIPMPEWYDAKSALPPAGMRVIATDGAFVGEAYVTDVGGNVVWYRSYGDPWEEFSGSPVTMWMDMPEVPERG